MPVSDFAILQINLPQAYFIDASNIAVQAIKLFNKFSYRNTDPFLLSRWFIR